jgi:hypothetical protein
MSRKRLLALSALVAFSPLDAQSRLTSAAPGITVREVSVVFISMADCCDALTPALRGPIDTLRSTMQLRALRANEVFRLIGVSLDWSPKVGWDYLRQFGEFDELGLGSNWYGLQPEILMFSGGGVQPVVPQLVVFEREVTTGAGAPSFGPRKILRTLRGQDQIVAWVRAGAPLP